MIRIWLDDYREMPDGFDIWVKSAREAMKRVLNGSVTFISFDHDLGPYEGGLTGYSVACCIEAAAHSGRIKRMGWAIHSANPVGRDNIKAAMDRADYFWKPHHCVHCGAWLLTKMYQGAGTGDTRSFACYPNCPEEGADD